jgi:hypothetical protein
MPLQSGSAGVRILRKPTAFHEHSILQSKSPANNPMEHRQNEQNSFGR